MKTRTSAFIARFTNDDNGISAYKRVIKDIRKTAKGGRFTKMFRYGNRTNNLFCQNGSTLKNGATHFDAYLHNRNGIPPVFI